MMREYLLVHTNFLEVAMAEKEINEPLEEADLALEEANAEAIEEPEVPETKEDDSSNAPYLPRESVIYDENASDAQDFKEEEDGAESNESFMYSLNFEEDTEEKQPQETIKKPDEEEQEQEPYNPDKPRRIDTRFDFVELFVFTLALVLFVTSFIIRHSVVVGGSMENTLYEGERLLISDLFYTPDYDDIIVFEDFSTNEKGAIVKRIIGLPGDTIEIKDGYIYRNGKMLLEKYVLIDDEDYEYEDMPSVTVPEGQLFVLGDHRNKSDDSRRFGTIDEDSVLGRVLLRFYPFSRFGTVN